eukprot:TRINITY_DN18531_c0_g1_i1.p1 TRINITY_DN18531_c0_g1~~TRINITY_DN18531_c0_g1_i1.p1  ORF type:complete len:454 (+),score=75.16 TRINITY_DN18531_c0_g1_i1:120-1481(+)
MGCGCCKSSAVDPNGKDNGRWASMSPRIGGKPSLAQLRKMHLPGPEELGGSNKAAFGEDSQKRPDLRSGASCLEVLESRSVLVAIRVRPLNEREKSAGSAECLSFENATGLTVKKEGEKDHRFTYDCVMRSNTAQQEVFDRTGRPLLHKVLEGYNGCLFAYGQTGSGKTFTMQGEGTGANRGVIPLLCTGLFAEIKKRQDSKNITVVCSVLEIYNERLKDLLVDGRDDLNIREDGVAGGRGIHVDGLHETAVNTCEDVLTLISKAQSRRAVGQTNMNEHSSRSHSVVTLRIASWNSDDVDGETMTVSKLHLIDLAGSERQKATGATGDRLKEGAQINLSLSALGNVINALTEPKGKGRHIPYRDSKLTRLLQDSLGGNSYTVIVCNISPATINAEETTSSLRFAERAKKIENKAVVNRDPKGERIAELLEENKALKAKVAQLETYVAALEKHY